jgi:hypothetical protein
MLEFHINGIIYYLNFCVWLLLLHMFLRFIQVVAYIWTSFLSLAKWYSIISIFHILFIPSFGYCSNTGCVSTGLVPIFFLSFSTGAWTQSLHLEPLHQPFFVKVFFFWDRILWTICQGWLWIMILLISTSWVARITGVSHGAWLVPIFNSFGYIPISGIAGSHGYNWFFFSFVIRSCYI